MAVEFHSNLQAIQGMSQTAIDKALEIIGGMAESYAKQKCPVDTGRLRNSITHQQEGKRTVAIGSNVVYAPFVELGTSLPDEGTAVLSVFTANVRGFHFVH